MVPITLAIVGVLFFVTLSYLEVIKVYTKAGGAYVVARDNFGLKVAQIAAVALLIDYTVTVAVSDGRRHGRADLGGAQRCVTRATSIAITVGRAPLATATCAASARPGRVFAIPTYFFVVTWP